MKLTAEQVAAECVRLACLLDTGGTIADTSEAYGLRVAADLIRSNLIESPDERRERFERWMIVQHLHDLIERNGDGYYSPFANELWHAFNAALDFGGGGGE